MGYQIDYMRESERQRQRVSDREEEAKKNNEDERE